MSLPLGHTAIGWAAYKTIKDPSSNASPPALKDRIVQLGFITVLANLPDLDILFGLFMHDNGSSLHRGPTHSILFAIIGGYLASNLWRVWQRIPRFGFGLCSILIFSHVIADMFLTPCPVSLLWPFELNFTSGYSGWSQVMQMAIFQSIQDFCVAFICLIYVQGLGYIRRKALFVPLFAFARRRLK